MIDIETLAAAPTISALAKESGLKWYEVKTLVKEHDIPHVAMGNRTIVHPSGLARLRAIIARYPGVSESFADAG